MKIFYKPVGITPNDFRKGLILNRMLSSYSCFSGRLDPMARGNMLFLEDSECKQMDKYNNKDKNYEFEIILGLSTDTDDIMGQIDNINLPNKTEKDSIIKNIYDKVDNLNINGQVQQQYHIYSSFMLRKGDRRLPLWKWKKEGLLTRNDVPFKKVSLYNMNIIEEKVYNTSDIIQEFISRILTVKSAHDFRQKDIIKNWSDFIYNTGVKKIYSLKISTKVSSGYYIRQFGNDLKNLLNIPLLIYDINRTRIII